MKGTPKGLSPRIQNGKAVIPGSGNKKTLDRAVESPRINIFREAGKPQKAVHQLLCKGGELRAEKVRRIRKLIANGKYEVDPREVANSIIHAARRRKQGKVQSINIDPAALLPVTEEEITVWKKMALRVEDQEKPAADWDVVALSKQIGAEPSLACSIFSDRRI